MNKKFLLVAVFLIAAMASVVRAEHHEEDMKGSDHGEMKGSGGGEMSQEEQEMMAKWQEYATPNENHKVLDTLVGSWDHTVKWWMSKDAEPEESQGTSETSWIMDGRFIQHEVEGESMGQPFAGLGITGYDNATKKYNSIWLDSMGTGIMKSTGTYDPQTKTITETGVFSCPLREGETAFRSVIKIIDDDHYTYEMHGPGHEGDVEFLNMKVEYTRRK